MMQKIGAGVVAATLALSLSAGVASANPVVPTKQAAQEASPICSAGLVFGVGSLVVGGGAPSGWASLVAWAGGYGATVLDCMADMKNGRAPRTVSCTDLLRAPNSKQLVFKYCDFWDVTTRYPFDYGWQYVYQTWGSGSAYYQYWLQRRG